jgi:hypothetical protein
MTQCFYYNINDLMFDKQFFLINLNSFMMYELPKWKMKPFWIELLAQNFGIIMKSLLIFLNLF